MHLGSQKLHSLGTTARGLRGGLRLGRVIDAQSRQRSGSTPAASVSQDSDEDGGRQQQTNALWSVVERGKALFPSWPLASQEVLDEANRQEAVTQQRVGAADITPFLEHVSVGEIRHIRKLSNLCGLSYKPHLVTPRGIWMRHRLELVTTSWNYRACSSGPRTAADAAAQGDGMAVGLKDATRVYPPSESVDGEPATDVGTATASVATAGSPLVTAVMQPVTVASKLAEAAAAAAAAATALAGTTVSKLSGNKSNISTRDTVSSYDSEDITASSNSVGALAEVSANLAVASSAAAASTSVPSPTSSSLASNPSSPALCPSEWFVCDDPQAQLRIFVIQGSDSIDHWRLNLTLDPVMFEDPSLGVTVHRGVYEAAKVLYDRFLPIVYEHLDSSPFAQITFTGHSIGGALAMLLTLMYKRRGVLQANSMSPCYIFGSPSIFCGLSSPSASCEWRDDGSDQGGGNGCFSCSTGGASRLLAALGMNESMIRNVIMHRDIVPRAFTCDYPEILSRLLKGWAFRSHCCLEGDGHKHLYSFVGTLIVLQPSRDHAFVSNDPDHPLLPPGPGLYYVREPKEPVRGRKRGVYNSHDDDEHLDTAGPSGDGAVVIADPLSSLDGSDGHEKGNGTAMDKPQTKVPASTGEAVLTIMDNPHPLQMLSDPSAYMDKGQISRFHHPDHLTQALGRIIHHSQRKEDATLALHHI